MLNFIYYPVSGILWFWHKAFGFIPFLGPASGVTWALSVVMLVFTIRLILFKPFVSQVRSMRKMQEFAPEIQKLKKKYGNDRQKMAAEMQKLQSEHGVNPLGGCLPILLQVPVFIGLFHVLQSFNRPFLTDEQNRQIGNYVFSATDVQSFLDAKLFGAPLSAYMTQSTNLLDRFGEGVSRLDIGLVAIPLAILAGILTHLTGRHSVARQTEAQAANPQAAIMNKVVLYLFPFGAIAGAPFFPLAVLIYWLSNNLWTLAQQRVVYTRIDKEEADKKEKTTTQRQALGPKPGQKPSRTKRIAMRGSAAEAAATKPPATGSGTEATPAVEATPDAGATDGTATPETPSNGSGATGSNSTGSGTTGSTTNGSSANGDGRIQSRTRAKKSSKGKRR